jgi:hypothetical protein
MVLPIPLDFAGSSGYGIMTLANRERATDDTGVEDQQPQKGSGQGEWIHRASVVTGGGLIRLV